MATPARFLALALLATSCTCRPALCDDCPNVSGFYALERTIVGQADCPDAPLPGASKTMVAQNGSRVTIEYDGALLHGDLFEDLSFAAAGTSTVSGVDYSWDFTGSFSGNLNRASGLRLRGEVVVTTRRAGSACSVRASVDGQR